MNRKIFIALILSLALFPALSLAATPAISRAVNGGSLREMDSMGVSVYATDSAGHLLAYDWSIINDTSGQAFFVTTPTGSSAEVGVHSGAQQPSICT